MTQGSSLALPLQLSLLQVSPQTWLMSLDLSVSLGNDPYETAKLQYDWILVYMGYS